MLTIIQSNRLDRLAEQLVIDAFAPRALGDLRPEGIIVPNAATARWLTYRIAEARGVCANVEFAYPAQYVWRLIALLVPGVPERSPFDANVMAWRILGLFQSLPASPETAPLRAYLAAVDSRASMALAQRVAVVFDDYRVHRGEWLQAWQEGKLLGLEPKETELWQAWVWRELLAQTKSRFSEHPRSELFAQIAHASAAEGALPETINVFAVPLLPPLYLEILSGLARHMEVRCYVLNPCREYWADIAAERELARLMLKDAQAADYREVGHPLLASWGKQARDNLALFAAVTGEQGVQDFERFEEPASNTVLSALQRSMLDLDDLRRTPLELAARDRSIQIHVCHSLVRELEVLHDCLLHFFETHGKLQPEDVVVMTPDLDAAAPMIDAVFGSAPRTRSVPYAITGRAKPETTPVLRAFVDLLALPDSRLGAAAVMDLLRLPAIARRFELSPADFEQARDWLRDAGVRWGLDAETRAAHGLAPEARHTWAEGLSRMLLGYALPGDRLFNALLPYDQIEGSQALVLGKLIRAVSELAHAALMLAQPRIPGQWARELRLLLDRFFNPDGADHAEVERIRDAIESLAEDARQAEFAHPIDHALVASLLREQLRGHAPGAAPTGAVTFCGMGALRGLPFRVVCVIGLADGAFPRNPSPLEFDLAARKRRLGDRVRRDEDRGAFLDALLAARDVFYLSYPGRDIRDNTPMPPSVLVSELLDYLAHCLEGGASAVSGELVTEHPLQPFSRRYFERGGLISYSSENLAAARALAATQAERMQARPFFSAPLALPEAEQKEVELEQLVRYLNHPIRFLLRERLGIGIKELEQKLEESEPFVLGFKESWRLSDRLLRMARSGISEDDILHISRFAPELPHGVIGEAILRSELDDAALVSKLAARFDPSSEPLPFELTIGDFTFSGALTGLTANGQFGFTPIRRSAYTLLDAWVRHLALNVLKPESAGLATRWLTRDALLEFRPADDAEIHLEALLRLYGQGIGWPVFFSARTALAWIEAGAAAARERWTGTLQRDGENMDPWFRLLFGELLTNLPEEMEGLAREVFQPLFFHLTEISAGELARQLRVENSR